MPVAWNGACLLCKMKFRLTGILTDLVSSGHIPSPPLGGLLSCSATPPAWLWDQLLSHFAEEQKKLRWNEASSIDWSSPADFQVV